MLVCVLVVEWPPTRNTVNPRPTQTKLAPTLSLVHSHIPSHPPPLLCCTLHLHTSTTIPFTSSLALRPLPQEQTSTSSSLSFPLSSSLTRLSILLDSYTLALGRPACTSLTTPPPSSRSFPPLLTASAAHRFVRRSDRLFALLQHLSWLDLYTVSLHLFLSIPPSRYLDNPTLRPSTQPLLYSPGRERVVGRARRPALNNTFASPITYSTPPPLRFLTMRLATAFSLIALPAFVASHAVPNWEVRYPAAHRRQGLGGLIESLLDPNPTTSSSSTVVSGPLLVGV